MQNWIPVTKNEVKITFAKNKSYTNDYGACFLTFPSFATKSFVKTSRNITSRTSQKYKKHNSSCSQWTTIGRWEKSKTGEKQSDECHYYNLENILPMTCDELVDKPERHFHKEQKRAFPYLVDGKRHLKVMLETDFGDMNSGDGKWWYISMSAKLTNSYREQASIQILLGLLLSFRQSCTEQYLYEEIES